jgi:hypothetical protein
MFIELWNHGTYGNTAKPCGEVDIYTVTGENIRADILKEMNGLAFFQQSKLYWFKQKRIRLERVSRG